MTDYKKLVEDLRITERICRDRMDGQVMLDAADAIEELLKTRTEELNNAWKQGYDAAGGKGE